MITTNNIFDETIVSCKKCKRLVKYANETLENRKKKEFSKNDYWCKPVPSFGNLDSEIFF